jgi:hypothetical protein
LISDFHHLTALQYLSISVKYAQQALNRYNDFSYSNERFLFDYIQIFIDRRCPNERVFKQVALQLYQIKFLDDLWATFVRYKNIFDRFDFYVSIILVDKTLNTINIPSIINPIGSYIEGSDPLRPRGCFWHVYSLPFILIVFMYFNFQRS